MRLRGHGWDDRGNLGRGILDAICPCGIVRLLFVFSIGDFGALQELAVINGTPQSKTLQLQAGKKYRFRFIIIATNNQGMQVLLRNTNGPVEWLNIAKDGADLPPGVMRPTKAQLTITVGETYDVEF